MAEEGSSILRISSILVNWALTWLLIAVLAFPPHRAAVAKNSNSRGNQLDTKPRDPMAVSEQVQSFPSPNGLETAPEKHLVFAALMPSYEMDNKNDCILPYVQPVLELAIQRVQSLGFAHQARISITLISRDTNCSSVHGPLGFFEIYMQWPEVNAVFGLSCEYVLAPISRYANHWQVPVFTTAGNAADFSHKTTSYSTLTRLSGDQPHNLGNAVQTIIAHFNWTRTALIYQNEKKRTKGNSICFFCIVVVHDKLHERKASVYQQAFDNEEWAKADIVRMLRNIAKLTRVVIMCADSQSIRQIMLIAEELNMIDSGEYVFINIELFLRLPLSLAQPWYDINDTEANNLRARKAYTAMLTVTPKQPDDEEYIRISNEVKRIAVDKYNYSTNVNESISTYAMSFYDGVILYAIALNESIKEDPSVLQRPINGTDMVRRMWNRSFTGIAGNATIDSNGDLVSSYSLWDMNPVSGHFEVIANFEHNHLEFVHGKTIHWAGNRTTPPPNQPLCGYDGSLCPDNSLPGYAILSIILGVVVVLMSVCFFLGYRHYKSESEINSMAWRISIDEVICPNSVGRFLRGSLHSLVKHNSQITLISDDINSLSGDRQIFIPVGFYRGCKAAIKLINQNNINLTRSLMLELKRMKDLQHDHLVKFYGACLDPAKSFILTEYCQKGSLQDILENEQFQLDWMFKLSLMHDIVRGMQFLHNSDIRSHGNLTSSNCVVDSRFVLKICDFGLHTLRQSKNSSNNNNLSTFDEFNDIEPCNSYAYWRKLLWTAPELLRMGHHRPPEGTQKGDIYSFAIIVHEITARQGPFAMSNMQDEKSPQDIIQLVAGYPHWVTLPYRPTLTDIQFIYPEISAVMQKCWSEDPSERPDFNALKTTIRNINKENETGNIVDNLLKRMEQYANNLEELVEERTQDYIEEKKKCEKLLYQLLPQTVAAQLISGQPVVAETFDQVTIYFSDIVGFTAISAESTPMQVVKFLNDLYTCFDSIVENYDVYKVETIGDAYMVVSGLPIRNGTQHAAEIARLALALLQAVHTFRISHRPNDRLKLRIGLHTGACVAGVVGLKMPRYCLFGDTVNTASRMESNGEALKIHISETTKLALDEFGTFITTRRGYVPMKGKGEMLTYWLEGEVPRIESPIHSNRKILATRRNSLKKSQQHSLELRTTEFIGLIGSGRNSCRNSPNLRPKRKLSSSSPRLNITGYEFKTENGLFNFNWDGLEEESHCKTQRQQQQQQQQQLSNPQNSTKSNLLTEPQPWQLINLRLPLSGTLKNQMINYSKGSTSAMAHGSIAPSNMPTATQSNYNLSSFMQQHQPPHPQNYHHLHSQQLSLRHKVKNCSFNNSLISLNNRGPSLVSTPPFLHKQTIHSSAVPGFDSVTDSIVGIKNDRHELLIKTSQDEQDEKNSVALQHLEKDKSPSENSKDKDWSIETISRDEETEPLKPFEDNNDKQDNVIDFAKDAVNSLDNDEFEDNNNFTKYINNSDSPSHIHLNHHHHHGHGNNAVNQPLLAKINS